MKTASLGSSIYRIPSKMINATYLLIIRYKYPQQHR